MLARQIRKRIREGSISFTINFSESESSTKLGLPNEKVFHPFVVAMRPLLSAESPTNLWAIWTELRGRADLQLSDEDIAEVERAFRDLDQGDIPIQWNDKPVTQRQIYERFAKGVYFEEHGPDADFIRALAASPMPTLSLMWFCFFNFHESAFGLAHWLFEAASKVDPSGDEAPADATCLFCRKSDGGFTSEEHIFPESLVGDADVLPKGYVCDRCNNETLSGLDEALSSVGPLAYLKTLYLPLTKKGKFPRAEIGPLTIEKTAPRRLRIEREDGAEPFEDIEELPDGQVRFSVRSRGQRADWRRIARALMKIALELVAFYSGHERAFAAEFDAARRFILEDVDFRNYLGIRTASFTPEGQVHAQRFSSGDQDAVQIVIYGVAFWVSLKECDMTIPVPEELLVGSGVALMSLCGEPRFVGAVSP